MDAHVNTEVIHLTAGPGSERSMYSRDESPHRKVPPSPWAEEGRSLGSRIEDWGRCQQDCSVKAHGPQVSKLSAPD